MTAATLPTDRTAPATEDLVRSVPFEVVRNEGDPGDGLTFRGYAAVFNEPTTIDSWEGRFLEQVAPGSFRKSLKERTPVFQFDHGQHPMIGSIPLGRITDVREDEAGVYVEARLEDNWLVQPVRDAIASGSINGMSFRFEVVRDRWTTPDGKVITDPEEIMERIYRPTEDGLMLRTLLEVKSRELGPVVFPAYDGTSGAVRSVTLDLTRMGDPEQRSALAAAIYAADHAAAPKNSPATSPGSTSPTRDAADHDEQGTEAPRATTSAGEHAPGSNTDPLRESIRKFRRQQAATLRFAQEGAHRYE